MHNLVTAPMRASRHLAIWLVWESTGFNLLPSGGGGLTHVQERNETASRDTSGGPLTSKGRRPSTGRLTGAGRLRRAG